MKIKSYVNENLETLDASVNQFEEDNNVKATQTDTFEHKGVRYHKAVVFYIPED